MSIIRAKKADDCTVMNTHHLRNKEISCKAKGLLSYMLSLPDDYDYSVSNLAAASKEGRVSVQNGLKELEEAGYLIRTRVKGKNGRFRYKYEICEDPDEMLHKSPQKQNEDNGFEVEYSVVDNLSYLDTNEEKIRCLQEEEKSLQTENKYLQAEIRRLRAERKKR